MSEKKYVGAGWETRFGINLSLKKEDLINLEADQYGNIKLTLSKRRAMDEKSKATHYITVNDYKK